MKYLTLRSWILMRSLILLKSLILKEKEKTIRFGLRKYENKNVAEMLPSSCLKIPDLCQELQTRTFLRMGGLQVTERRRVTDLLHLLRYVFRDA